MRLNTNQSFAGTPSGFSTTSAGGVDTTLFFTWNANRRRPDAAPVVGVTTWVIVLAPSASAWVSYAVARSRRGRGR